MPATTSAPRSSSRASTQAKSSTSVEKKEKKTSTKRVRVVEPVTPAEKAKSTAKAADPVPSADSPLPAKGALKKSSTAGKKAKAVPEPVEVEKVAGEEQEEEEIDFLKGFESADGGEDSSDEEMEDGDAAEGSKNVFESAKLPKVDKETAGVQNKLEGKDKKKSSKTGTIYLGRIPHGFHEAEMKSYFSQFGEVTRMRLSRNKTTGASKHYAFLEFAYASVAQIVQETMDNYLLAGHILVCKIVPEEEVHPKIWIGANRVFRVVPKGRKDRVMRAAPKTDEQKATITSRLLKREEAKRAKLVALGIDYEFSGYAEKVIAPSAPAVAATEKADKSPKAIKGKKEKKEKKEKSSEPAKKKARKSM